MDDKSPIHDAKAEPGPATSFALMRRSAIWSMVGAGCIVAGYITGMKIDDAGADRWLMLWCDWLGFVIGPCLPVLIGGVVALMKGRYRGEAHWAGVGTIIGILSVPVGFIISVIIGSFFFGAGGKPPWNLPVSVDLGLLAFCVLTSAAAFGAMIGAITADAWAAEPQDADHRSTELDPRIDVRNATDVK